MTEDVELGGTPPSPDDPTLVERAEARADAVARRFDKSDWIELVSALLLALATIAAAWCAYQSTRWSGVQANAYAGAGAARQESVRASNRANAQIVIDVQVFQSWIVAKRANDTDLADFWRERFRAEFVPAFEAWLASVPAGQIPPESPFAMPQYQPAEQVRADELAASAEASTNEARDANQTGDNFVLLAVIFASVLFFAGVGTKFKGYRVRVAMVSFAVVMFAIGVASVLLLPQNVGI
jgi:hypothetical protein